MIHLKLTTGHASCGTGSAGDQPKSSNEDEVTCATCRKAIDARDRFTQANERSAVVLASVHEGFTWYRLEDGSPHRVRRFLRNPAKPRWIVM
jgi:hypothetical protein